MFQYALKLWIGLWLFQTTGLPGPEDAILGSWKAIDLENSTIEVYVEDDGTFFGRITNSDNETWPGKIILQNVSYQAKGNIWTGELISPKRNVTIDATLILESESRLKITGKKYFMTKVLYWERS